jgi:hypothetical protein
MLGLVAALGLGQAPGQPRSLFFNRATDRGCASWRPASKGDRPQSHVSTRSGPALNQRIVSRRGSGFAGPRSVRDYIKQGKVVAGSVVEYAGVGNGVAVKAGAPKPDISTPEAFKLAMLNARSIGHTNAGTGPFNTRLFQKLGIYDQIKDRIKIIEGRLVAEAVAAGDIEIGIQQTNVIQPVAGSEYLGPLPLELMEYARVGVGLLTVSKQPEVASAFIKFMADPANAALLKRHGAAAAETRGNHHARGQGAPLIPGAGVSLGRCREAEMRLVDRPDLHGGNSAVRQHDWTERCDQAHPTLTAAWDC